MPGASFSCSRSASFSPEGARSPADVDTSATPRTRSPNSSGRAAARHMIVMPPIEWPPSTTGPVGSQLVEQVAEVGAELVDGQLGDVVGVAAIPGRAAVPALVVADQPQLAVGDPGREQVGDVVPGGLGQRPAVGEHEGDRRVVGAVDDGVDQRAVAGADGGDAAEDGAGAHAATSAVLGAPAGTPT